jgi:hypothetical protein
VEVDTVILKSIGYIPSIGVEEVLNIEDLRKTVGPVPRSILTITGKFLSDGTGTVLRNNLTIIDLSI